MMKRFAVGGVFVVAVVAVAAGLTWAGDRSSHPNTPWLGVALASASTTACFDITTDGANITHIFVESGCAASASEYMITVDGIPVEHLYTDDGPCESILRDVWFPLQSNQDTAQVCVTVQEDCPEGMQVYGKAGDECIAGTQL